MKALTLTPPWGTLVACGAKTIETRSWRTHHRGPLAIHQAKSLAPVGGLAGLMEKIQEPAFDKALTPHLSGYTIAERVMDIPTGIVAVVWLDDCRRIAADGYPEGGDMDEERVDRERAFGNYAPGRFAWIFSRCVNLGDPVECRGRQGLWTLPEWTRLELTRITEMAQTPEETERFLAWAASQAAE